MGDILIAYAQAWRMLRCYLSAVTAPSSTAPHCGAVLFLLLDAVAAPDSRYTNANANANVDPEGLWLQMQAAAYPMGYR